MFRSSIARAPVRTRPGLRSHFLLDAHDVDSAALAVSWVEVEPGECQEPHRHPEQQIYVVIAGRERMRVHHETTELGRGGLAYVPPNAVHGIQNLGEEPLRYVAVATPAIDMAGAYASGEAWDLDRDAGM